MVDLGIIIVTHNSLRYLDDCLHSIASSHQKVSYEIVVVDNNSTDRTIELVERNYPAARLIQNKTNPGFAAANNKGIRSLESRYVMLLNPDTIVNNGVFDALVGVMDSHTTALAVGPAIMNGNGTPQRTGVRFPSNWSILVETFFLDRLFPNSKLFGRHKELYEDLHRERSVDYLQGACLLVRSDVVKTIGGLDEAFFMYFEETDWCFRMKKAGGEVVYAPVANVVHFGGGEFAHYDEQRLLHYHRSLMLFYRKHYSLLSRVSLRPILAIRSSIRIVLWSVMLFLKPGNRPQILSSIRGYVAVLPMLVKERI